MSADLRRHPASVGEADGLDLRRLLALFARRWAFVLLVVLVAAGSAYGLEAASTERWSATAQLLVSPTTDADLLGGAEPSPSDLTTELVLVQSQDVQDAFRDQIDEDVAIETSAVETSQVIEVTATSANPELAALAANTYADTYVALQQGQIQADVAEATAQLDEEIAAIDAELAEVEAQLAEDPFSTSLVARRDALIQQQIGAQQARTELQSEVAVRSGGSRIASRAETPTTPAGPSPQRSAMLAGLLGLLVAGAAVLLLDRVDDTVRSIDDLEAAVDHEVPTLGEVPAEPVPPRGAVPRLVSLRSPDAPAAEAYRSVRTTLDFVMANHRIRSVLVTSSLPGEGKTTTVANLAVAFAQVGRRVIAIDGDLRQPRLHEALAGDPDRPGLSEVIAGTAPVIDAVEAVPEVPDLVLLGAGHIPPNPSELLTSGACAALLDDLSGMADLVLVDSSPLLLVSDPLVLAGMVDGVVLVARSGATGERALRRSLALLEQVEAPVLGVVLNGTEGRDRQQYGYGYGYGRYGATATPPPAPTLAAVPAGGPSPAPAPPPAPPAPPPPPRLDPTPAPPRLDPTPPVPPALSAGNGSSNGHGPSNGHWPSHGHGHGTAPPTGAGAPPAASPTPGVEPDPVPFEAVAPAPGDHGSPWPTARSGGHPPP